MQPEYFVNIKSGSTVQGSGPITSISDWTVTRRMDAAGSWSFRMSAADAQAGQVVLKRTVEIYAFVGTAYTLVGGGIVDVIERQIDITGVEMLYVEGGDDLRELTYRSALTTFLRDTTVSTDWLYSVPGAATVVYRALRGTSGRIVAATGAGGRMYTSDDSGVTWQDRGQLGSKTHIRGLYECAPGIWLAGAAGTVTTDGSKIFRSDNDGTTWTEVDSFNNWMIYGLGLGPASTVVAFGQRNALSGANEVLTRESASLGASGSWVTRLSDTTAGTYPIIYAVADGLIAGTDTGANAFVWDAVNTQWDELTGAYIGASGTTVFDLVYISSGVWWAATNDGGKIYVSTSATSWSALATLTGRTSVTALLRVSSSLAYAGADGRAYRSTNDGVAWTELRDLGSAINEITALADGTALFSCANGRVYTATDVTTYTYDKISHADAVDDLEALAPAGWTFNADASPINDDIYLQFAGESLLAAVGILAETTQTHFYLSAAKTLTFTDTWSDSGVHAVQGAAGALDASVAAILTMTVTGQSYDVVTRCYPYGKVGGVLTGIDLATSAAPTGYTLSTANNYLQHTAAHSSYGLIEQMVIFDEVTADVNAATFGNALVAEAWSYLERAYAAVTNYAVQLGGCSQLLEPMETVRITYIGDTIVNSSLYILESTWQGDATGMMTTGIVVADAPVRIVRDVDLLAAAIKRIKSIAAR